MTFFSPCSKGQRWKSRLPHSVPRTMVEWLRRPGSLTASLQKLGSLEIRIVREGPASVRGAFLSSDGYVVRAEFLGKGCGTFGGRNCGHRSSKHNNDTRRARSVEVGQESRRNATRKYSL